MHYGYAELKLSWALFQKAPEMLADAEFAKLARIATRQSAIEQTILASPEAANVIVPGTTLATRIAEIRARYQDEDEFRQDMQRIGLTEDGLKQIVELELRVEALLDKVASKVPALSSVDAEIYYRLHPEAFTPPESRRLRHILLTYNDPKQKLKVLGQLQVLRSTLENAEKFGEAAQRLSQCPTALSGGELGVVKRQQLYAELEDAAFALQEGQISEVLESPIGLHILRCDEIFPGGTLPFVEVREKIIERLTENRRSAAQKEWIKALSATTRSR
jgi:peptidyl-prolyl cis-trans isomerase C